ncbi:helix-turn-helix transcriptional regulator [Tamlana fucoidanivorans]|uniref:Helix-turn-helix transcriptional regulator n=1 Tax=Allotamlana fucoidanivorans TaxID=2583814 RepID=A0A5C4SH88_9FLAO|nr:helix-turn-helix domain-containing protein [Tamlana fucoidanivorans]TNJ42883.1 helix-turn-helix transcriptional regulator [Tamlana fucoidanivorans]
MIIESYFELILLMGGVLSFLLAMYLIFYPSNFYPNKILGALVFSWSVTVFVFILHTTDFYQRYVHLYAVLDVFTLMFFPLMFLYLRNYLYRDIKKPMRQLYHFIPAVLYLLVLTPFFAKSSDAKLEMLQNGFPVWYLIAQSVFNIVIIIQGIFYSIFCLRTIHRFQYFRKKHLSAFQLSTLVWLRLFVFINIILWTFGTTGAILELAGIKLFFNLFNVFYAGLTLFTIVLGIFTTMRPELFSESEDIKNLIRTSKNKPRSISDQNNEDFEVLSQYIEKEKPYLKTDLKMQDLVESTGITYKRISEVFNKNFNKSFYEVMNEYRLEEAKHLIAQGFHQHHTLNYLAEKAGFNSKTTFNRIFKKYTDQTPSDYIKNLDDSII